MTARSRGTERARLAPAVVAVVVGGALLGAACGDAGPGASGSSGQAPAPAGTKGSPKPRIECSASGMSADLEPQSGLSAEAARIRGRIAAAAVKCDLARLERLALAGSQGFTFSYGGGESPAGFWRRAERDGEGPMASLVKVLGLPYVEDDFGGSGSGRAPGYSWPSAHTDDPRAKDWQAVIDAGLATEAEVEQMKKFGGYLGYRVGITGAGDWLFFVAGD